MTETIKGLDALNRKLKTLEQFQRKMKPPMQKSLDVMHRYIATQFPKKQGAFSAMASDKQKRAYWAQVSSGKAEHREGIGYVRQGRMKAWTTKVTTNSNGVKGELGNAKWKGTWKGIYIGEFIQGKEQQDWLAASGIRTTPETLEKHQDKVQGFFNAVIKRELNR